ncbi:diguanylate cyclase [Roseiarcaceae bacterium H3SJ34-1]|uniref:diguanylate cyclase domain-containing protein n=1 Tax=Terripilifer ovatus TaxID=3032367 RepID=UPI003AB9785E|nr:diguanylate cyclase [Roseiarcaceae bacterium H3SJ34-1]
MIRSILTQAVRWIEGNPQSGLNVKPSEETAGRIRAVQINAVARNTPIMMLASAFNASIVRIGLMNSPSSIAIDIWTLLVISLSVFLFLRQSSRAKLSRPKTASMRGIRLSILYALLFGLLWGALPLFFFANGSHDEQLVITCVSIGMICGGAFTLACIPLATFAFVFPIIIGSAVAISNLGQSTHLLIAGLLVIYTAVMLSGVSAHAAQLRSRVLSHAADEEAAHKDFLTGLPNRLAFNRRLTDRLSRLTQGDAPDFAVFYFDLDHFKSINDTKGHEAGDQVLIQTAKRLREATRRDDFVARLGGDEFILIAESFDAKEAVISLASRINEVFSRPFMVGDDDISSTISIGIAFVPEAGQDFDVVLRHADEALYATKETARGSYSVWRADLVNGADAVATAESEIAGSKVQSSATLTWGRRMSWSPAHRDNI